MKVALVHDWLTGQRGGEKVLEVLAEIFPKAPIYTLFHFKGSQREDIERRVIRTSFLQGMPFLRKKYRSYLPLFPLAVEMFDLQAYDLVVSTSHCVAKGVIPRPDALHVSYIHSPIRYAWNHYFSYFSPDRLSLFSRFFIPPVIHGLRIWDAAARPASTILSPTRPTSPAGSNDIIGEKPTSSILRWTRTSSRRTNPSRPGISS